MREMTIQIKTEYEKVNAIRIYTNGKGNSLEQELADYVDALYKKYVPQAVREFIEKADEQAQTARRVSRRKPVSATSNEDSTDTRGNG